LLAISSSVYAAAASSGIVKPRRAHDGIVGTEKRREKVLVLRELQRVIIYTRELSKHAIEGHVSTAFIRYSVNEGARLTGMS
jgi:hypothetical protein